MSEYKELYLPFYFTWREMTSELTDSELGEILRALLDNYAERRVPTELSEKMRIIYKFMLDGALRTHTSQRDLSEKRRESANTRWGKNDANLCKSMQDDAINENGNINGNINGNVNGDGNINQRSAREAKKERHGDFDPQDAFIKALERSYGKEAIADVDKYL